MTDVSGIIPDAATAIKVATALLETYMGAARFKEVQEEMPLLAKLDGDVWSVFSFPPAIEGKDGILHVTRGGGGPCIKLSRHDARVLELYFQR